jgi:hypothetical protein
MTAAKAGLKLATFVVAMLATIGAWEIYKATVNARGDAYAQDDFVVKIEEIHRSVVDAGNGLGPRLHFKCYGITPGGASLNQPVVLFDQFFPPEREEGSDTLGGGDAVTVRARHHLCTPALKLVPTTAQLSRGRGK